jgi:hypothetical protein
MQLVLVAVRPPLARFARPSRRPHLLNSLAKAGAIRHIARRLLGGLSSRCGVRNDYGDQKRVRSRFSRSCEWRHKMVSKDRRKSIAHQSSAAFPSMRAARAEHLIDAARGVDASAAQHDDARGKPRCTT